MVTRRSSAEVSLVPSARSVPFVARDTPAMSGLRPRTKIKLTHYRIAGVATTHCKIPGCLT